MGEYKKICMKIGDTMEYRGVTIECVSADKSNSCAHRGVWCGFSHNSKKPILPNAPNNTSCNAIREEWDEGFLCIAHRRPTNDNCTFRLKKTKE